MTNSPMNQNPDYKFPLALLNEYRIDQRYCSEIRKNTIEGYSSDSRNFDLFDYRYDSRNFDICDLC